jgi:heme-degrading monooxygenase HmoA
MYIATNRFLVLEGSDADFEAVWLGRDSHLDRIPGFVEFHLLKGPEREDHVLYASQTIWRSFADFEAWTRSEAFRAAHRGAGGNKPLYLGHPAFEGSRSCRQSCRGPSPPKATTRSKGRRGSAGLKPTTGVLASNILVRSAQGSLLHVYPQTRA